MTTDNTETEELEPCPLRVVENAEGTWDILVDGALTHPRLTQWTKVGAEEAVRLIHEAYTRSRAAVAAPRGDDLIKRQDAVSLARAHDKRHSSGYRCYEGEAIADKIAALPAYVPDIRSAAERVSRAIAEGGLTANAPSAKSWDEGKHDISSSPVAPSLIPEQERGNE